MQDAARPRVKTVRGEAARREAASLPSNRRPARVVAAARLCASHAAGMLNRPGRQTHSDRMTVGEAQGALRPVCPANEAINSNRRNRCPAGEGISTPTAGLGPRTKGFIDSAGSVRAACKGVRHPAATAVPSWATFGRASQSSWSGPGSGITPPGFYGRKPWKKPNSATILAEPTACTKGLQDPPGTIRRKCSQKFTNSVHGYSRQSPRVRARFTHRRSSHLARALRVSESAVLRQLV